jgi:Cu+-exporting ATPase
MIRRHFLQLMTLAGAVGLAPLSSFAGEATRTVTYKVKGFSCVTCATGLDTMLCQERGIVSSKSTYPEGVVNVSYLPTRITPHRIAGLITDLGFTVASE